MKRFLSLLTAAALVLALIPAGAFATEGDTAAEGLCPHHRQHDTSCGYSEAAPENPCTHVHTEECYTSVTQCVHTHTEQCYSDGVLPAEGEEKTPDVCAHVCSAETGCITKALDCKHVHDENCGYAPATAGTPCAYDCEICSAAANEPAKCTCETKCAEGAVNAECPVCTADSSACSGTAAAPEPIPPQVITVSDWSWVDPRALHKDGKLYLPQAVTAESQNEIVKFLPQSIQAGEETILITWTYDPGTQSFTAALPGEYVLAEGTAPLTVAVVVKDANPLPAGDPALTIGTQGISATGYWTTGSGALAEVSAGDSWNVHYDADTNVLTLKNATITGGIEYHGNSLTIALEGTSQVSGDDAISLLAETGTANLTIRGTGSLASASQDQGYGIHLLSGDGTGASLTVDTCTLTVDGNPGIYFSSNSGSVSASLSVNNSAVVRANGGIETINGAPMNTVSGTGIVFSENKGTVYGTATLNGSLTMAKGETLTIPSGASLTVPSGVTLTNNGTITSEGTLTNNGTVTNYGTISGSVTGNPVVTIVSNVPYMENGSLNHATATLVNSSASDVTWTEGWYVVEGTVNLEKGAKINGDVKLILADGCSLTVPGINVSESNTFSIYGQRSGTGILQSHCNSNVSAGIGAGRYQSGGVINIYGGIISASGGKEAAGIGGSASCNHGGTINIYGGTVTATGGREGGAGIGGGGIDLGIQPYHGGNGADVHIYGGNVTAIGQGGAPGIGGGVYASSHGTLTGNIGYAIEASSVAADTTNFNGIVYSGTTYQVYGDVTLTESLEIKTGETLNVPHGASLTIPDPSMITGSGSISLSGPLKMEPESPEDITVSKEIFYTGNDLAQTILDAVSISNTKQVTVAGQEVNATLIVDGWTKTLKEGTAVNTGTYTVQFTKDGKTIEKSVTVEKSGSTLEQNVSTDKSQYVYGDTVIVTAMPKATGAATFALIPPTFNQMAVYAQNGQTQLSQAVAPDSKGVYTMTLDSARLGAGTHTLIVKFTGNDNLAAASLEITVVIDKANPTYTLPTGLTATIGSTLKDVPLPSGWAWKEPDTNVENVGERSFPAVFTPADIANYNTLEVSLTVSVGKADLSAAKVTLGTAPIYNGQTQTQAVNSVTLNGKTLTEGTDYTIAKNTGKGAGTYTLTVTGEGNYTGTLNVPFEIAKAPLTITGVDVQNKTYDGTTTATVTGVGFDGLVSGEALALGTDYTATADFDDAGAGNFKTVTGKVTLLSSTVGKNYVLSKTDFLTAADISTAPSKLDFKADRTKPVKGQYVTFSVTPQIKGDNRSFLQRILGIGAPKVEFWVGSTKLGEVKVEEGKTSTFAYDTDKGGLKLGKNTVTAEFTGDGNLKGCTESIVIYLHDSTTSAPTGDESNIQTWTVVLAVSALALIGLGAGAVIYRKKK